MKIIHNIGKKFHRKYPSIFSPLYNSTILIQDNYNALLYYLGYKKNIKINKINTLYFTVTNICNANCIFCPYEHLKDKKECMSMDIFKKAVDQFVEQKGEEVGLTPAYGEALVDPNIFEKIKYCKEKEIKKIFFFTNGILLNKYYKKLVLSGVTDITISFGEFNKKTYSQIHRVPESKYDEALEGLINFIDYNGKKGHPVKITVSFRPISHPNSIFKSKILKQKIEPYVDNLSLMYTYNSHIDKVTENSLKGIMKIKRPFMKKKYPCMMLYESVTILPNGDVKLCGCTFDKTLSEFVIGNINEDNITNIFYGKKAQTLRKSFKKHPICKICTSYSPLKLDPNKPLRDIKSN